MLSVSYINKQGRSQKFGLGISIVGHNRILQQVNIQCNVAVTVAYSWDDLPNSGWDLGEGVSSFVPQCVATVRKHVYTRWPT